MEQHQHQLHHQHQHQVVEQHHAPGVDGPGEGGGGDEGLGAEQLHGGALLDQPLTLGYYLVFYSTG